MFQPSPFNPTGRRRVSRGRSVFKNEKIIVYILVVCFFLSPVFFRATWKTPENVLFEPIPHIPRCQTMVENRLDVFFEYSTQLKVGLTISSAGAAVLFATSAASLQQPSGQPPNSTERCRICWQVSSKRNISFCEA